MQKVLARAGITLKAVEKRYMERDEATRQRFIAEMLGINLHCCLFLDESGFARYTGRPRRAWASRGTRAVSVVRGNGRGFTHLSVLAAISTRGVVAFHVIKRGFDLSHFEWFVMNRLLPLRDAATGSNTIIVMDNARIHVNTEMLRRIEASGLRVIFTPTYSPDTNPIELIWSPVKAFVRRQFVAYLQDPVRCICAALRSITPAACYNSIAHMRYGDTLDPRRQE